MAGIYKPNINKNRQSRQNRLEKSSNAEAMKIFEQRANGGWISTEHDTSAEDKDNC